MTSANPIKLTLATLSLTYIAGFVYDYAHNGLNSIEWHTHFAFPLIGLIVALFLRNLSNHNSIKLSTYVLWLVCFSWFVGEVILYFEGSVDTYAERNDGEYKAPYIPPGRYGYYWVGKPYSKRPLKTSEFSFWRTANEFGYYDCSWTKTK